MLLEIEGDSKGCGDDKCRRMGENGRRAALEHYDYAKLARRLEQVLLD